MTLWCWNRATLDWYNEEGYSGSLLTWDYTTPDGEEGNTLNGPCPGGLYEDSAAGGCSRANVDSFPESSAASGSVTRACQCGVSGAWVATTIAASEVCDPAIACTSATARPIGTDDVTMSKTEEIDPVLTPTSTGLASRNARVAKEYGYLAVALLWL